MRPDDLDDVALIERNRRPFGARHDGVIDRDGDAGFGPVDRLRRQQVDQAGALEAVGRTVQADIHVFFLVKSSCINRPSPKSWMIGSTLPVNTSPAMASAVAGVSNMPLR